MGSSAMPVSTMQGANFQSPLYAGNVGAGGRPVPVGSTLSPVSTMPGQRPTPIISGLPGSQAPTMPVASSPPTQAPVGLTATPNPGQTSTAGVPGSATGTMSGLTSTEAGRVLGENQNYLGQGMGALVTNYLETGAGYNGPLAQQAITATDTAMQEQINQQYGSLQTSLADAGLSPNSSGAALASSQFLSNASAQENEVAAQQYTQMYAQSQQDYLSMLQQLTGINAQGTANQRTVMGAIGSLLTGGVGGLAQYEGGAAGEAGNVTSQNGIAGPYGTTANAAASIAGVMF